MRVAFTAAEAESSAYGPDGLEIRREPPAEAKWPVKVRLEPWTVNEVPEAAAFDQAVPALSPVPFAVLPIMLPVG